MKPARRAGARPPTVLSGYVLHQHDWSESSLIVDAFSRELGRLLLVARGAKRPHSQLRPVLMPFQRLQLTIGRVAAETATGTGPGAGPGAEAPDLHNLRHAEWAGGHAQPRGAALFSGFYLHELLRALLPRHDPHPELFDAYAQTVAWLASSDEALHAAVLRAFECRLLREVGLLPALDTETAGGQAVRSAGRYRLTPEVGVVADDPPEGLETPSTAAGTLSGARLLALHQALQQPGLTPLVMASQDSDLDLKPALRGLLHYHLAGAPLRTRALMRDLQSL